MCKCGLSTQNTFAGPDGIGLGFGIHALFFVNIMYACITRLQEIAGFYDTFKTFLGDHALPFPKLLLSQTEQKWNSFPIGLTGVPTDTTKKNCAILLFPLGTFVICKRCLFSALIKMMSNVAIQCYSAFYASRDRYHGALLNYVSRDTSRGILYTTQLQNISIFCVNIFVMYISTCYYIICIWFIFL